MVHYVPAFICATVYVRTIVSKYVKLMSRHARKLAMYCRALVYIFVTAQPCTQYEHRLHARSTVPSGYNNFWRFGTPGRRYLYTKTAY